MTLPQIGTPGLDGPEQVAYPVDRPCREFKAWAFKELRKGVPGEFRARSSRPPGCAIEFCGQRAGHAERDLTIHRRLVSSHCNVMQLGCAVNDPVMLTQRRAPTRCALDEKDGRGGRDEEDD